MPSHPNRFACSLQCRHNSASNMHTTRLFIWLWLLALPAFAENLVLVNGTIIDGTGKPKAAGSIRIRDGKIADMGLLKLAPNETRLDIKGMVVMPGFIDLESA